MSSKKMKNFQISTVVTISLCVMLIIGGCGNDYEKQKLKERRELRELQESKIYKSEQINFSYHYSNTTVNTVVIDSCEYLYAWFGAGSGGGSFTHKGNCKYCNDRSKK